MCSTEFTTAEKKSMLTRTVVFACGGGSVLLAAYTIMYFSLFWVQPQIEDFSAFTSRVKRDLLDPMDATVDDLLVKHPNLDEEYVEEMRSLRRIYEWHFKCFRHDTPKEILEKECKYSEVESWYLAHFNCGRPEHEKNFMKALSEFAFGITRPLGYHPWIWTVLFLDAPFNHLPQVIRRMVTGGDFIDALTYFNIHVGSFAVVSLLAVIPPQAPGAASVNDFHNWMVRTYFELGAKFNDLGSAPVAELHAKDSEIITLKLNHSNHSMAEDYSCEAMVAY